MDTYAMQLLAQRTCGREKEYSVTSKRHVHHGRWVQADESGDVAQRILRTHSRYRNNQEFQFLKNAARLYDDYGKLEYATAECFSPDECVLYDKAGDRIVAEMAQQACRDGETIDVHNDNSDGLVSYACHTSYQILRSAQGNLLKRNLITFLVATGAVLFGAGEYKNGVFYHSSRAQFIDKDVGDKTRHGARAILNTRTEHLLPAPHRDIYTRLHITSLDTKVSEIAIFMEVALTWIVLSMSEMGWDVARYYPVCPVRALKDTSTNRHHPIETSGGHCVTALDIQQYLLDQATRFIRYVSGYCRPPSWMIEALKLWQQAIVDLRHHDLDDWPPSSYWIDWWAKYHLLQEYRAAYPRAAARMLPIFATEYHNLDPRRSLAQEMVHQGLLRHQHSPQAIAAAAEAPSSHPRARRRSYWINHDSPATKVSRVRWEDVIVNGKLRILEFD